MATYDDWTERVTKAPVGLKVTANLNQGRQHREEWHTEVLPACDLKTGGAWYCVTHDKTLTLWERDHHTERGKHILAWVCPLHGIEHP